MIVHTYLTNGFFPWAKLFVRSFRKFHKEIPLVIDTRNLTKEQCSELRDMSGAVIRNINIDMKKFLEITGLSYKEALLYKKEVEEERSYKRSIVWKQFISVEDRYGSAINNVFNELDDGEVLLHFDIDMYIRKPLDELYDIVENNDVSIRFRLKYKDPKWKVLGNIIGLKVNKETKAFLNKWKYYIDAVPLVEKEIAYGQTSFYYAYIDMKEFISWGDIPSRFSSHKLKKDAVIWTGNDKHLGKRGVLDICLEDFNR